VSSHEIDSFRRDLLSGDGQIAFVFAILIVDDDHHFAYAYGSDGIRNPGEWACPVTPLFHDLELLSHVRT
jgi:hypothetical protein